MVTFLCVLRNGIFTPIIILFFAHSLGFASPAHLKKMKQKISWEIHNSNTFISKTYWNDLPNCYNVQEVKEGRNIFRSIEYTNENQKYYLDIQVVLPHLQEKLSEINYVVTNNRIILKPTYIDFPFQCHEPAMQKFQIRCEISDVKKGKYSLYVYDKYIKEVDIINDH